MSDKDDIKALVRAALPAVSQSYGFAVQALRQSIALAELLVEKGLVTRAELDARLRSTAQVSTQSATALDALEKAVGAQQKKPS